MPRPRRWQRRRDVLGSAARAVLGLAMRPRYARPLRSNSRVRSRSGSCRNVVPRMAELRAQVLEEYQHARREWNISAIPVRL